jgi:hypothetical protein
LEDLELHMDLNIGPDLLPVQRLNEMATDMGESMNEVGEGAQRIGRRISDMGEGLGRMFWTEPDKEHSDSGKQ